MVKTRYAPLSTDAQHPLAPAGAALGRATPPHPTLFSPASMALSTPPRCRPRIYFGPCSECTSPRHPATLAHQPRTGPPRPGRHPHVDHVVSHVVSYLPSKNAQRAAKRISRHRAAHAAARSAGCPTTNRDEPRRRRRRPSEPEPRGSRLRSREGHGLPAASARPVHAASGCLATRRADSVRLARRGPDGPVVPRPWRGVAGCRRRPTDPRAARPASRRPGIQSVHPSRAKTPRGQPRPRAAPRGSGAEPGSRRSGVAARRPAHASWRLGSRPGGVGPTGRGGRGWRGLGWIGSLSVCLADSVGPAACAGRRRDARATPTATLKPGLCPGGGAGAPAQGQGGGGGEAAATPQRWKSITNFSTLACRLGEGRTFPSLT